MNRHASTLADVMAQVTEISRKWAPGAGDPEELWFRGSEKVYPLVPGGYRPRERELNYSEEDLCERFKARAGVLRPEWVSTEWDWYFLAQHHGISTRLLDWTDNLLIAIYFAIYKWIDWADRRAFDRARDEEPKDPCYDAESPVVWVLDAGSLNAFACGEDTDCILAVGGELTQKYRIEGVARKSRKNRWPIAILPPHTNSRIVAQQGVFTIHGHCMDGIDVLATQPESKIRLAKILLDRANLPRLWRELERLGISRASVFPDLDSIAETVKWFGQRPDEKVERRNQGQVKTPPGSRRGHAKKRRSPNPTSHR